MSGIAEMHTSPESLHKQIQVRFLSVVAGLSEGLFSVCVTPQVLTSVCLKWKECTCRLIGIHL